MSTHTLHSGKSQSGRLGALGGVALAVGLLASTGFASGAAAHTPEPQAQQSAAVQEMTQQQMVKTPGEKLKELRAKGFGRKGGTK